MDIKVINLLLVNFEKHNIYLHLIGQRIFIMEIKRLFDIVELHRHTLQKEDLLCRKENKSWKKYSSHDFVEITEQVASGLIQLGLKEGDRVAIISENRPEWTLADYACQQINIVTVPIFPTISNHELQFILNHCEAKLVFIAGRNTFSKLTQIESYIPTVKHVISFSPVEGLMSFEDLTTTGKQHPAKEQIKSIKDKISAKDLLTILYTSGTTGTPKGVMLSHENILENVKGCQGIAPFASWWKALSFLPLNHVYERMLNTLYLYNGISIYFAEGFETIGDNLKEVQPQIFVTVPRLLERVFEKIEIAGEKLNGNKRKVFDWSIQIAEQYEVDGKNGWLYEFKRTIADKLVYSKWREAVGGKLVCLACGGAALNPKLERIFLAAKIMVLQGYGLTETSPVVSVNRLGKNNLRIGTVGPVIDSMKVSIAEEDGEILVKGPCVMMGYYKNEDASHEAIDQDGWFHTGDVGTFIDNRFLKITDRKKEIFKTSSGKYIAPLAIENKLKESRFIEQCMVIGESQKFASALIVPDFANYRDYCKEHHIEWKGNADMSQDDTLKQLIHEHIHQVNKTLAPYEQLKRCEILDKEWSVDGGELTPKLSLKRKVIKEKNASVIGKIFSVED